MKTKFTVITTFVLFSLGIAANAERTKSEIGKQYFLAAKNGLHSISKTQGEFKNYFVNGNQLSVPGYSEDFSWDEDLNDWQHVSNTTYSYNYVGKLIEEIVQDAETSYYLTRNTYSDDPNYISEEVSYTWIIDGWIPVSGDRSSNTLSGESPLEGYPNGILYQTLENEIWVNKTWEKYILNSNGIPTELQEYRWEGNNWILYSRTGLLTWADWPNRQLAAYTKQIMQNNNWVNAERVSKQFDGDNYTVTTEIWENQEWVNSTKETYSRTEIQEELILENWTESGWEKTEKYKGTFDAYGNPTGMFYSSWYETGWELEMELFFDLLYNESNDLTEMVFRYRDPEISEPVNISKYNYSSFLHFTTDVPEINVLNNVKVFPNPVNNSFTVKINEIQTSNYKVNIVNLAGQTVFNSTYSDPDISINTEGFPTGMYLLNIKTDDGRIYNSKILKN